MRSSGADEKVKIAPAIKFTLEEALEVVKSHLEKSFWSVILFTTSKDVTFKINRKGAGSISEKQPTFSDVIFAEIDED